MWMRCSRERRRESRRRWAITISWATAIPRCSWRPAACAVLRRRATGAERSDVRVILSVAVRARNITTPSSACCCARWSCASGAEPVTVVRGTCDGSAPPALGIRTISDGFSIRGSAAMVVDRRAILERAGAADQMNLLSDRETQHDEEFWFTETEGSGRTKIVARSTGRRPACARRRALVTWFWSTEALRRGVGAIPPLTAKTR